MLMIGKCMLHKKHIFFFHNNIKGHRKLTFQLPPVTKRRLVQENISQMSLVVDNIDRPEIGRETRMRRRPELDSKTVTAAANTGQYDLPLRDVIGIVCSSATTLDGQGFGVEGGCWADDRVALDPEGELFDDIDLSHIGRGGGEDVIGVGSGKIGKGDWWDGVWMKVFGTESHMMKEKMVEDKIKRMESELIAAVFPLFISLLDTPLSISLFHLSLWHPFFPSR